MKGLLMELDVRELYKRFGDKHVLKGVGFHAGGGRALGLLGRNGAGKTTTIRIIMGVFPADSGSIILDGRPLDRKRIKLGYLPEEHGLYPKKPIDEQLCYLARLRGMTQKHAKQAIKHWLSRLAMEEYEKKPLDTLSKGNQQKIQLAACLVTDPDFVILDEPFSGLDPVNAALLKAVVKELIDAGKLVLFSSHQMNYVEEFCDSIAILHEGVIALSGGISEIKRGYERGNILIRSVEPEKIEAFCNRHLADISAVMSRREDELRLRLKSPSLKAELFRAVSDAGFDIDLMCVSEPTLEEIFVEYTGSGEQEATA